MLIKIHKAYRRIVAICDSELINKIFEQDLRQINIRENFFKGEEKNKQEIIKILQDMNKEDATFNIIGKESTQCAIEAGIIDSNGILEIDNVPVALVLM